MIDKEDYFKELREQIFDENKWDSERFAVFDYEAGTGKSQNVFRYIAEMTKEKSHRVLYVQRFVRDKELYNTVATINQHAGKRVAEGIDSKDSQSVKRKKEIRESKVLCISHQMYKQVCLGNRPELSDNRDILIIDEYFDATERVSLHLSEVATALWAKACYNPFLETLANLFRMKMVECEIKQRNSKEDKIIYVPFDEHEFDLYRKKFSSCNISSKNATEKTFAKIHHILTNGCLFYESAFHTFDSNIHFQLFSNNILLDANGFDFRYSLSSAFQIKSQPKFFDYQASILRHYEIGTGKKELKGLIDFGEQISKKVAMEKKEKTLIITDKDNVEEIETSVQNYFHSLGMEDQEIKERMNERVKVDYFGNIIGVNTYRDFDSVVILKTPYFDYLTYVLTYFYFLSSEGREMSDIEVFQNEEVESIRKTVVAGEIYQAIKRINRNNQHSAELVVCCDFHEAMDIIIKQLPSVQYIKDDSLAIARKKEEKESDSKFEEQVALVKSHLLEKRDAGVKQVRKKEIRSHIEISDKSNFSKIVGALEGFFLQHGFVNARQRIILNEEE